MNPYRIVLYAYFLVGTRIAPEMTSPCLEEVHPMLSSKRMSTPILMGLFGLSCLALTIAYVSQTDPQQGQSIKFNFEAPVPTDNSNNETSQHKLQFQDAAILARVKTRLIWNARLSSASTNVELKDGIASVSGAVDTHNESTEIVAIVQNTPGVIRVVNHLDIVASAGDLSNLTDAPGTQD